MAQKDDENLDLVNESFKEEQERKDNEAQQERKPSDTVGDYASDAIDRVKDEGKDRLKEKIRDKLHGSGETESAGAEGAEATTTAGTETATAGTEAATTAGTETTTAGAEAAAAGTEATAGAGAEATTAGTEATTAATKAATTAGTEATTTAGTEAATTAGTKAATTAATKVATTAGTEATTTAATATAGTGTAAVGAGSFLTGVGEVVAIIVAIVIILMLLIGFVYYFVTMPGTLKGKINEIVKDATNAVVETIAEGDSSKLSGNSISVEKRIEVLQYIEDMGIDVVGYGFAPGVIYQGDVLLEESRKDAENEEEVKQNLIDKTINNKEQNSKTIVGYYVNLMDNEDYAKEQKDSSGNIGTALAPNLSAFLNGIENLTESAKKAYYQMNPREDLIYYYLMANERAYVQNDNGLLGKLFSLVEWSGMLDIDVEGDDDESIILAGAKAVNDALNPVGAAIRKESNKLTAEVDRANETLIIKKSTGLNSEEVYSFPLEGWTGRFGMPLEFSLALHLSTMSSGMVEELLTAEDLQTTVSIGLSEAKCKIKIMFYVKDEDGNIRGLDLPFNDPTGDEDGLFEKINDNKNKDNEEFCNQFSKDDLSIEGLRYAYEKIGEAEGDDDSDDDNDGETKLVDKFNTMLKEVGYDYFTKERIDYLYETFKDQKLDDDKVVKYAQPYIKGVIKHWYKDVDFLSTYGESNGEITQTYALDKSIIGDDADVVAILTPTGSGTVASKGKQPLVVKGDIVLCDGKKVDAELSKVTDIDPDAKSYHWGDGYRTTKKIFTQGYYYTFDGTQETAKSIYYQEEMEDDTNNELFAFGVDSGRIIRAKKVYGPKSVIGDFQKDSIIDSNGNFLASFTSSEKVKCVYNDNGIKVYSIGSSLMSSLGRTLEWYVMYAPNKSLKYKSPVTNSREDVEARVETINAVWDSVGVVCKRRHLTFDTVAENESELNDASEAQIMARTGLAILKNTDTQDAEYIYRDLKEMLIELGYYTEAEFEYLDTDVLMWFIPDYMPSKWPQNTGNEKYDFAAVLYPKDEVETDESGELSEEEQEKINLGLEVDKSQGFDPDLNVVAPGDCRIINLDETGLEIEFTSDEEPEIGILDGYTMIIEGINSDEGITLVSEDGEETQISYQDAISQKTIIKVGSVIGKTGTEQIRVIMLNDRGELLSNIEHYMAPDKATVSGNLDNFSLTGTVLTEKEFVDSCLAYLSTYNISNSDFSEDNLKQMYRICKQKHINPEWMFVTAIWETSLSYRESHNYWGIAAYNGGDGGSRFNNITEGITAYSDLLIEYQNPTSGFYSQIMSKYEERSACTENGGCDPNGYGTPDTVQGVQSLYSYLGEHGIRDQYGNISSDAGGQYYTDPAIAGVTAIYKTHEEYLQKCASQHPDGTPPTVWEDNQYNAWQVERRVESAKSIFGDKAGTAIY